MHNYKQLSDKVPSYKTKFLSLANHSINFLPEPETSFDHLNQNSIFEFEFKEEQQISFCGISVSSILRNNNSWQNQILSITDFSDESDKKSVLFVGDLFSFNLNPTDTQSNYQSMVKKVKWVIIISIQSHN